jgi:hypothetical protein
VVLLKIRKEYEDVINRKKWVLSPKRLAVSEKEWTEFKRQKIREGVKLDSLKRYERDRKRLLKLIKLLQEEKAKAKPKKVVVEEKEVKEIKFHKTHVFEFECEVPLWSDWKQRKTHYVAYRVVKDEEPDREIALYLHNLYFPEHRVLNFGYYKTMTIREGV